MKSKGIKPESITIVELLKILLTFLGILVTIVGIITAILLKKIEGTKNEITVIVTKQTERAAVEIKNSLSKQTEDATSEIRDSLSKQTDSINAQIAKFFIGDPNVTRLKEGAVYVFKRDPSSSFTIVSIDPETGEVAAKTNIEGEVGNVTISSGRTTTISIPQGGTYYLILIGIDVIEENRIAKLVISEEKGAKR